MANERRLIDANDFEAELKEHHNYIMLDPEVGNPTKWREAVVYNRTLDVLKKMPTVDAVEVVRCKDCKMLYNYSPVRHFCCITGIPVDEDDFCSHGERRTDEQTD